MTSAASRRSTCARSDERTVANARSLRAESARGISLFEMAPRRVAAFVVLATITASVACSGFKDDVACAPGGCADASFDGAADGSMVPPSDADAGSDAPTDGDGASGPVLALGHGFSCALMPSGALECWGTNKDGEQGPGDAAANALVPHVALDHVRAIGVGPDSTHACAALEDGAVVCWGSGDQGQLGSDAGARAPVPTPVVGVGPLATIAAGAWSTCAVAADGGVVCWGDWNGDQAHLEPAPIAAVRGQVVSLAAGTQAACAVLGDGGVVCWGNNSYGQLGDPGAMASSWPTLPGPAAQVTTSYYHVCALLRDGRVACWGYGANAQLGVDPRTIDGGFVATPTLVPGIDDAIRIGTGLGHTCALHADGGTVSCWGWGAGGANGDPGLQTSPTPRLVPGIANARSLTVGATHSCVVVGDAVRCWGTDGSGELGDGVDGTFSASPRPAQL